MGMSELIPGCASGDAVAIVGGEVMRGLARAGSAWGAQVVVQTAPGELRLDALVLGAELREAAPPQLLPLNSEPTDLLRLHVREAAERIADAGLDEAVATALARLDRSCERAAEHLGWLGVSPQELRAWLLSRYGADSAAPREIVVVEPTGQVRLFDD